MQTRKQFLGNALSLAAGSSLAALTNLPLLAKGRANDLYFDFHCHPGLFFNKGTERWDNGIKLAKTISEMNASHISGGFFSLVADMKLIKLGPTGVAVEGKYGAGEAWNEYKRQLKQLMDLFETTPVRMATHSSELVATNDGDKVAAFVGVEGGDFLEGRIEKLDEVYRDGVRSIQLVHYAQNDLGDLQTEPTKYNGLSFFGKDVVKKMNKLGMLVDVAHASFNTAKAAAEASDAPIMLSHSILEMEGDRPIGKRAISKEHAKIVAQTGGLIGAWPSGFNKSFEEFVDNTLRLVDTVGIDHVGIGTDMDGNFKPVLSSYTQYPSFAEALRAKGLSQVEVEKIVGVNAKALLSKVFKK